MQLQPLDFDQNARADASGFTEGSRSSVLGESGLVPSLGVFRSHGHSADDPWKPC